MVEFAVSSSGYLVDSLLPARKSEREREGVEQGLRVYRSVSF